MRLIDLDWSDEQMARAQDWFETKCLPFMDEHKGTIFLCSALSMAAHSVEDSINPAQSPLSILFAREVVQYLHDLKMSVALAAVQLGEDPVDIERMAEHFDRERSSDATRRPTDN